MQSATPADPSMLRFWIGVIYQAASQSLDSLREGVGITAFTTIALLFTAIFMWYRRGGEAVAVQSQEWLAALPAIALAWLAIFLLNVIRAPFLMHTESQEEVAQATGEIERLKKEIETANA